MLCVRRTCRCCVGSDHRTSTALYCTPVGRWSADAVVEAHRCRQQGKVRLRTFALFRALRQRRRVHRSHFQHYAFGAPPPRSIATDHLAALHVPVGTDAISRIGPAPQGRGKPPATAQIDDAVGREGAAWIGAVMDVAPESDSSTPGQPGALDLSRYPEPAVDAMRALKDAELARYRQEAAARARRK